LYIKLGSLKPKCPPLHYTAPDEKTKAREKAIAEIVRTEFPGGLGHPSDPLFGFLKRLEQTKAANPELNRDNVFTPRFCYSYFAPYGDPLLNTDADPYPAGYLSQLAATGVNGVWLQGVLYKLAPFPWEPSLSAHYRERLKNLKALVARAKKHGISLYLYLNEPRAMPLSFFKKHPELKGVTEGDHAALCTSVPAVKQYIRDSVATICKAVPDLGGFFTITASENLTNCWSHNGGMACPRCSLRPPGAVVAEVSQLVEDGIQASGSKAQLIAWDWGWREEWAAEAIRDLPKQAALMSVSEWSMPIERGGISSTVGEYSISTIGPGPRALDHWEAARKRGMKTIAKIQAGNTWELSAVPYIPAVANVAQHVANLRDVPVDGLMLGWTLGGYPSPNLEVVADLGKRSKPSVVKAMNEVARRRYGKALAPAMVKSWQQCSTAFSEFPFQGGLVYNAPLQVGPANLLYGNPTGYHATMVGIPYDDLESWRSIYPTDVFVGQFKKIADGFDAAINRLKSAEKKAGSQEDSRYLEAVNHEIDVTEAATIHFRSVANQAVFITLRTALKNAASAKEAAPILDRLNALLDSEAALAKRLYAIQCRDSRIGFEASNQYFYVPLDLAEKVLNCRDLQRRWLPAQRARFEKTSTGKP